MAMALRLERIYRLASQTGYLARFVVFGSFVTTKPRPNDVDVFMLMEDTFYHAAASGFLTEIDRMQLEVREYLSLHPAEIDATV